MEKKSVQHTMLSLRMHTASVSDGTEVNPSLSVDTNKHYPRTPDEISHENTYTLTLIAFEIC